MAAEGLIEKAIRVSAAEQAEATNTSPAKRLEDMTALVDKVHAHTVADDRKVPIATLDRDTCVSELRGRWIGSMAPI